MARIRREREGVSIAAVKEALNATNNDYAQALKWLDGRAANVGLATQQKTQSRGSSEGVVCLLERKGVGAIMLEVNCETDFVARTAQFQSLVAQIACTTLLMHRPPLGTPSPVHSIHAISAEELAGTILHFPILPDPRQIGPDAAAKDLNASSASAASLVKGAPADQADESARSRTVQTAMMECVGRLGEGIHLRRAVLALPPAVRAAQLVTEELNTTRLFSHIHGHFPVHDIPSSGAVSPLSSMSIQFGKIGCMVVAATTSSNSDSDSFKSLGKQLAQHVVGMRPRSLQTDSDGDLEQQPWLFDAAAPVQRVLQENAVMVRQFVRFECGERDEDAAGVVSHQDNNNVDAERLNKLNHTEPERLEAHA